MLWMYFCATLFALGVPSAVLSQRSDTVAIDITGEITRTDTTFFDGTVGRPVKEFRFQARPNQRLEINLQSRAFDAFLRVIDESGKETTDDDGGDSTNARVALISGQDTDDADSSVTYRVQVTAIEPGQYGEFRLVVVLGSHGTRLTARQGSTSLRTIKDQPYDSLRLPQLEPGLLRVELSGARSILQVVARDAGGELLTPQRVSRSVTEFSVRQQVNDLFILDAEGAPERAYSVTVFHFPQASARTVEQSFNGELTASDVRLPSGELYDRDSSLTIRRGEVLTIHLTSLSPRLDPFLVVEIPALNLRWTSDDDGVGTNARVTISDAMWVKSPDSPEQAKLLLHITSAGPGELGKWNVRVLRQQAQSP